MIDSLRNPKEPSTQATSPESSATFKKRGNAHLQDGELEAAAECYRKAISINPGDAAAHVSLGFALRELQAFAEAQRSLQQALTLDPNVADADYLLGSLATTRNAPEEAIGYFRRALEVQPDLDVAYRELFALLFRNGQTAEAQEVIARAIARWPRAADLRCYMGNLLSHKADHAAAVECYREALAISPDVPGVHNDLGCALEKLDRLDEAGASYQQALALRPGYVDALVNLGNLSASQRKLDEARTFYERAIASDPARPEAHLSLATVLQTQDKKQEAIACLRQAVSQSPKDIYANWRLGAALEDQGRWDEAIEQYRQSLSIDPKSVDGHVVLGNIFLKLGRYQDARRSYREVVRLDPSHSAGHIVAALTGVNADRAPDKYVERLFDEFADTFETQLVSVLKYDIPRLLLGVIEDIAKPQPRQWDVLDLGCGTGLVGAAVAPYARHIVGVDLSSKMLAKAAERNVYQRLEKLDLLVAMRAESASTYDLVLAADVFVYVGKLDELIAEAKKLLRPGGLIGFSTEDIEASTDAHAGQSEPEFQLKRTVRYGHSPVYLRRLAADNGFEVCHLSRVQIRMEKGKPVHGHVAVWASPGE